MEQIPDVTSVSPGSGSGVGGTTVTIGGSGFEGGGRSTANVVAFTDGCGDVADATNVDVVGDSSITATAPPAVADFKNCGGGADSVPVDVTVGVPDPGNGGQEITSEDQSSDQFTYMVAPPTITSAAAADFTVGPRGTFTVTTTPGVDPAGDGNGQPVRPGERAPERRDLRRPRERYGRHRRNPGVGHLRCLRRDDHRFQRGVTGLRRRASASPCSTFPRHPWTSRPRQGWEPPR